MAVNLKNEVAAPVRVLMPKEEQKSRQDALRKVLVSTDAEVHLLSVQALYHCSIHGDTSLMTRLLTIIIDAKSGYRRQGLINWVRKFSPMELKGQTIDLSGTLDAAGALSLKKQFPDMDHSVLVVGARRPFLVDQAEATPFWSDADNAERVAKPVFKDTLMSKIDSAYKEFNAAIENTANGKPIDPSKAFYDGIHADKITDFFVQLKSMRDALPADETLAVRKAQAEQRKLADFVTANSGNVNAAA